MGSIRTVRAKLLTSHPRSLNAWRNTFISALAKGGGMVISLLLVPVTIDYLSVETYGTWLTISSILSIISLLDIGLGNGLRNKFSEAVSRNEHELARSYISTSYVLFGVIQLLLLLIFAVLIYWLPWPQLISSNVDFRQMRLVALITITAISVKLVLDNISTVLIALQQVGLANLLSLSGNVLVLAGTYWLAAVSEGSLMYLATVTVSSPLIVLSVSSLLLYRGKLRIYCPAFSYVSKEHMGRLVALGYQFFFIQIAVVILFYSDNLIITHLFGSADVTVYAVAFRYFNIASAAFAIIVSPYWPAFTEAYVKQDMPWVKATYRRLQQLWILLALVISGMIAFSGQFYNFWLTDRVDVPFTLSLCMGISVLITCWNNITSTLLNGIGKIQLQLYYSLGSALVNIPLSVFFARTLALGPAGVALATAVSLLIGTVLGGIQVEKILSRKAAGLWDR
ncbi:lipopolysaccharide biosynthesis protein [Spirosoma sp. KUDC1026]|uniref:lipopolysaccharide biosynthesis protein n=1 Tax=Spirosoma sp. KUDC1026 TaxID=2745947 RepID=UPI00159BCF2A|nr:oligosaccharide flippase family protein [Spirosoma sp. KUDC1026]QKZ11932.1 oligosaccharide flippase family protein [Spirosoma sp. KUDC1026]